MQCTQNQFFEQTWVLLFPSKWLETDGWFLAITGHSWWTSEEDAPGTGQQSTKCHQWLVHHPGQQQLCPDHVRYSLCCHCDRFCFSGLLCSTFIQCKKSQCKIETKSLNKFLYNLKNWPFFTVKAPFFKICILAWY